MRGPANCPCSQPTLNSDLITLNWHKPPCLALLPSGCEGPSAPLCIAPKEQRRAMQNGTPERIRTSDPKVRNLVLYPLSYGRAPSAVYESRVWSLWVEKTQTPRRRTLISNLFLLATCPGRGRDSFIPSLPRETRRPSSPCALSLLLPSDSLEPILLRCRLLRAL